ncbi:MAG TPA: hypothetical protein ENG87_01410 [Candidatus Pacearchaeota archaeon]|nr:hypothetical protein [Candidatus Pacearchaeota archaeon]
MTQEGDIRVFNPNKEIATSITLEILIRHRDALKQARLGYVGDDISITENVKRINQVRGLNLIISAQKEMITISRPIVFFSSTQRWKKKYRDESKREEHPFDKDDNDYNTLVHKWLAFLNSCEMEITNAERTKTLEDDFIIKQDSTDGRKYMLTTNFYDMLEELETSYEQIYLIMLINKIVSAGIEEDDELTYKEKEAEAIKRIVDA